MSEGNPYGQRDNSELKELIRELELQIEGVNAGLGKIRGTVARIAYASLGSVAPPAPSTWSTGYAGAPANRPQTASTVSETAAPSPTPSPATPTFGAEAPRPVMPAPMPMEEEPPAGFWTSVAEGASWPRAHAEAPTEPAAVEAAPPEKPADSFAWAGFRPPAEPEAPPADAIPPAAAEATQPVEVEAVAQEQAIEPDWPAPVEVAGDAPVEAWMLEAAVEPLQIELEPEQAAWHIPAAAKPEDRPAEQTIETPSVGGMMPNSLSSGWPDESAWSQSFEWPALKAETPQPAQPVEAPAASGPEDVSDIVAQVRAELAAARAEGIEVPMDLEPEATVPVSEQPAAEAPEMDEEARREEVSRAVAEMRQQLDAGDFEGAMRGNGFESGSQGFGWPSTPAETPAESEEDVRAEVRRAVEAAREELSGGGREAAPVSSGKPAFRLAAPGSIPDWSHVQMEPSGPPVVVMKDADGRVELASVYETLNELGCGDGAALLNYTPHTVTVGLPISAQVPSKERVAEAVEKVFGLSSRVESDGVRITVSIGVDPKRRSVDAA